MIVTIAEDDGTITEIYASEKYIADERSQHLRPDGTLWPFITDGHCRLWAMQEMAEDIIRTLGLVRHYGEYEYSILDERP